MSPQKYICYNSSLRVRVRNLRKTESRRNKLEAQLSSVGERVQELKDK